MIWILYITETFPNLLGYWNCCGGKNKYIGKEQWLTVICK